MSTEAEKAAACLRSMPGTHRHRAQCERAASLVEHQAKEITKQLRIYSDLCMEVLELRAQIQAVKAVLDPLWSIGD